MHNRTVNYCFCHTVDETVVTVTDAAPAAAVEKEDTQIKPAVATESLETTPSEPARSLTPSPSKRMMEIVAEAGGSARHLLAHIRSHRKRGKLLYDIIGYYTGT